MYYAAGILASSETAGGRPGRAWSAPSSSCLGPCSRSLSRANTPSPRLLHVSLTITLRRSVSISGAPCVVRCLPNTLLTCQDVPGSAPTPLFSVGSKVIRNTLCARRRGSVRLQMRNQRISETTRLQSSARALINRRAPKASIFSACACHTARSSTFSACALRCYTDISIRFTLCNKETKERVYKIGKGTARGVYNQSLDG